MLLLGLPALGAWGLEGGASFLQGRQGRWPGLEDSLVTFLFWCPEHPSPESVTLGRVVTQGPACCRTAGEGSACRQPCAWRLQASLIPRTALTARLLRAEASLFG